MPDIDPKQVKYQYNHEVGVGPDGNYYNRGGYETYESRRNRNEREYKESLEKAKRDHEESERKKKEARQRESYNPGRSYSGPSFSLGSMFAGIGGLFSTFIAADLLGILLFPLIGVIFAIIYYVGEYAGKIGDFFKAVGTVLAMPFTAWPTLLGDWNYSIFTILEIIFSIGIIYLTIRAFRNYAYFDVPYWPAVIGLIVLEVLFRLFEHDGLIYGIYNGFCLAIPVLIILKIIDWFFNR